MPTSGRISLFLSEERWNEVLGSYKRLAEYFLTEFEEYHVAAYFYTKSIDIAEKLKDHTEFAEARLGLSKCYVLFDRSDDAINLLEKTLKMIKNDQRTMHKIAQELIENYKRIAAKYDTDSSSPEDQEKSLDYYQRCLDVCTQVEDTITEGQIANKIGQIYFKRGDYENAVYNNQKYLEISRNKVSDVALFY